MKICNKKGIERREIIVYFLLLSQPAYLSYTVKIFPFEKSIYIQKTVSVIRALFFQHYPELLRNFG